MAGCEAGAVVERLDELHTYAMFIGYPRSGHSLVGALMNAHPDMLISHERDVLRLVRRGYDRAALFAAIAEWDARFAAQGRVDFGFCYAVPGAWQGQLRSLRVIGDKKGGRSAWWLHDEPALLERLRGVVGVPVRLLHVIRNPWDNIASISRWGRTLDQAIAWYLGHCAAVASARRRLGAGELMELRHEALVADPRRALSEIAAFLGVDADPRWLDACAACVRPAPHRSRDKVAWTAQQRLQVQEALASFTWFSDSERNTQGESA